MNLKQGSRDSFKLKYGERKQRGGGGTAKIKPNL